MFRVVITLLLTTTTRLVTAGTPLIDSAGRLDTTFLSLAASSSTIGNEGVISLITSPGTTSLLSPAKEEDQEENMEDCVLSLESDNPPYLHCRGPTLRTSSTSDQTALATTSLISGAVLMDGITEGDVEAGWSQSRHARTLTALFRSRFLLVLQDSTDSESMSKDSVEMENPTTTSTTTSTTKRQSLILCVKGQVNEDIEATLHEGTQQLFDAVAMEMTKKGQTTAPSFLDYYKVHVVSVTNEAEVQEAKELAQSMAADYAAESTVPFSETLDSAYRKVRQFGIGSRALLDPPHVVRARVAIDSAYAMYARMARAKSISWKNRIARGLLVDNFGRDAEAIRQKVLQGYDSQTLATAGLLSVSPYRLKVRNQLANQMDTSIQEAFAAQIINLQKSSIKKLRAQLLKLLDVRPEEAARQNSAAMRAVAVAFETTMIRLEVPSLRLSRAKACRDMESILTDEVLSFSDSPAAKLHRTKAITQTTEKQKKPGERGIKIGLDLVAMLRPDGFGTLQGFAGYQFAGNSITVGVHNDADDPQAIAQFGGVRPPLLRIQPKLRVDVEM